ncbi:hypothetical protein [Pseudoalteromonas luteoviolacea]|uniref:Uncharacterized protein n=1 Tax=Pseudoalteromonas luteoviolacea S4054 TaxID=1129367 RepID=A0A0F6A4P4_9GAMM|nr:hypothetical protein [Pseudoalteromonas luteoviolacea]AOT06623.1 hypothetical protein S4054249_01400 [Pseudoalteromonas luteoviolacea]AOT11540.1 hypothetical protein S40542_01400 [Pseudoalteromonas luteoviolacea]AOT16453.1 hypothetical protein S4054_01400 [Pseudoalteromonas luteoviolacea]KKE81058.1 hypothetical protein N479_03365 [Pseudoalteromonas luteoviolacea S4054]KZN62534.1 hypothetical protein N481_03570 [Pseudoalteromonas luteoviolacea S4047-1]
MATWLQTRTVLLATAAVVSIGVFSFGNDDIEVTQASQCECSSATYNYNEQHCKREAHTSWYAWLTGGSSNAQFHYLDLLELLIGSDDQQDSSSISDI